MIIDCPDCNKKFDIDQNLIPSNGRLLQCGSCNHQWFFKLNIIEKKTDEEIKKEEKKDITINEETNYENLKTKTKVEREEIISIKKEKEKNISFLNILLVIIISSAAFILVLDTFKDSLISVFPNIKFLLDNLYKSTEDLKLFILDLIK